MHFRHSDVSAVSYQVLDTILSQAHRVTPKTLGCLTCFWRLV